MTASPGRVPSRRAVLGASLSLAILTTLGAGAIALQPGLLVSPRTPLRVLDARTFSVLAAVADTICPGDDTLPSAWALEVPEKVDALLDTLHPASATELGRVLMLLESGLAGLVLDGRSRPFTRCTPDVRARVLERWRTSGWMIRKSAYKALVSAISAAYWSDPRTWAHTGYPGPPRFGA